MDKNFWLFKSNRVKHLIGGLLLAIPFTILCTFGCALGMEFKDCHHYNTDDNMENWNWDSWDWKDFLATMIGGIIGGIINFLLIYAMYNIIFKLK